MSSENTLKMKVLDKDDSHPKVLKIKFRVNSDFEFKPLPGQYLFIEGNGSEFPFSIASTAHDILHIHVKRGGSPHVEKLLEEFSQKSEVSARGPFGDAVFHLDNSPSDIAFICAGEGYAQSHAYLRELDINSFSNVERVSLIWLFEDLDSAYDLDFLSGLQKRWPNFDVTLVCRVF